MGLERYVVDAVLIEKRSPTEIAKALISLMGESETHQPK